MLQTGPKVRELVRVIVYCLVERPHEVIVTATSEPPGKEGELPTLAILVQIAPRDLGKVVGRQGKTAEAIRHVVKGSVCARALKVALRFDATP
jgi:predicted RNA-binding protein YlqC (UPF0109 family)